MLRELLPRSVWVNSPPHPTLRFADYRRMIVTESHGTIDPEILRETGKELACKDKTVREPGQDFRRAILLPAAHAFIHYVLRTVTTVISSDCG